MFGTRLSREQVIEVKKMIQEGKKTPVEIARELRVTIDRVYYYKRRIKMDGTIIAEIDEKLPVISFTLSRKALDFLAQFDNKSYTVDCILCHMADQQVKKMKRIKKQNEKSGY